LTSNKFIQALEDRNLAELRRIPKTDFHNHGSLGFPLDRLRARAPQPIPDPPEVMPTFIEFIGYLKAHLQPLLYTRDGFIHSIADTLVTAHEDTITELEISIDPQIFPVFGSADSIVNALCLLMLEHPDIIVRPEVGINREWDETKLEGWVMPLIDCGYFAAVDLYGNEMFGEPEVFVKYFEYARSKGMRCKAHAGEYRGPDFIRHSVETLQLDEVQHGITAAESEEVMRFLADHSIRLNVCPTSNIRLARVADIAAHPVRKLYDAGIHVTLNSDDILVFNQSVSEEYLNLYEAGMFSAEELDGIRVRAFRG
jgi:adenosine deaminase